MSRINSNWYTKGKFDRKNWRNTIDTENEFLYSKGRYPTKIKEEDLPKDYTEVRSRTIWYMKGFVKTSGVKDLYYTYIKENHLFKDDYKRYFEGKEITDIFEYYKGLKNAKTYFISDTHFNHKNIIKYCKRPFKDVEEMNKVLIENWNNTVTDFDTVFHLGDVALTSESDMKELIPKLKGKKFLIRGNHDKKSIEFFRSVGFGFIPENPLKLNNEKLILSHKPLKDTEIPKGYVNVHGHIHNNPLHKVNPITNEMEYPEDSYSEKLHINVSVDVIGFKPISLKELLKKVEEKKK